MTYDQHLANLRNVDPHVADQLGSLMNLQAILNWIPESGLSLDRFDSVQQDEYNYDVLFQWYDHRWIEFGVT